MQQVVSISQTSVLREAWERGQDVSIHGWCYRLDDGLVHDLGISATCRDEALELYRDGIERMSRD